MTCPRCNTERPDTVNFCPTCGLAAGANPPQYQQYPPYYPVQMPGDSEANIALICGIISLFAGFILGIIAIVMGKKAIQLGSVDSKAKTGMILGWVSVALTALSLIIVIIYFAIIAMAITYRVY